MMRTVGCRGVDGGADCDACMDQALHHRHDLQVISSVSAMTSFMT